MSDDEPMISATNDLREIIAELLEAPDPDHIVLAPGILIALRMLFSHFQIQHIVLTSEEYYGAEHFPGARVRIADCDSIFDPRSMGEFDALVASPASWRGIRQPVAELFDSIRSASGGRAPLLVADYAHAGSVGFPPVDQLGADVVCGDLEKWILPPERSTRVAFLWLRTHRLFGRAAEAFRPFFLATSRSDVSMLARWVDPGDVLSVSRELASLGATAEKLRARHAGDMELARRLATRVEPARAPETSILWFTDAELELDEIEGLEKLGLVWRLPGRGTRVLCRSDVVAEARAQQTA